MDPITEARLRIRTPFVAIVAAYALLMAGLQIAGLELPARDLHAAKHPYTRGLLDSLPRLEHPVPRLSTLQRQDSWRDEEIATPLPGGL